MAKYYHVNVFSKEILNGNGLTVVFVDNLLSPDLMLRITQEFRQFETIFLQQIDDYTFKGNVFTMEEQLPFAGHPILGAGACIHREFFNHKTKLNVKIKLGQRKITINSVKKKTYYSVSTDQGPPDFLGELPKSENNKIIEYLNLHSSDLHDKLPIEIVSTGLPYLIIPTIKSLNKCKITKPGFEEFISKFGAKFVYVFDIDSLEARTWDNDGVVEDVATGSAAGALCAYLVKHGIRTFDKSINIFQGKYVNRPSIITTKYLVNNENQVNIQIEGEVSFFAKGRLSLS